MSSTRIVEWASVNHRYTAVTDGLVIRASLPDSLVAKIFKSHVSPDSLWALDRLGPSSGLAFREIPCWRFGCLGHG